VALSITEAEYIASCEGAKDTASIRQLTTEMHITATTLILRTDSEGAQNLLKTAKFRDDPDILNVSFTTYDKKPIESTYKSKIS
jgi:isocitrate lyase